MDGQTIFAVLIGAALACFSLVMVGYAFFRGSGAAPGDFGGVDGSVDDAVGLDSIFDSIDTLDLEYQLGNVPEPQYRELLQSYRLQAAQAIKRLLENGIAPPELRLEQEVLAARWEIHPGDGSGEWIPCPQCDAPLPQSAAGSTDGQTCPHCGAVLTAGAENESSGEAPQPEPEAPSQAPVR